MNTHFRSTRIIVPLLCGLAMLLLAAPTRAAIALHDAATVIQYVASGAVSSTSYTVTTGASVLVVVFTDRDNNSPNTAGNEPSSLTWNSQTLTKAISTFWNGSTYRDVTIYYLYNPTPGASKITGTSGASVSDTWLMAYTLSGVSTASAPMTGSATTSTATSMSFNVASVQAGSWAAVDGCYANITGGPTFTITGTGATAVITTDSASGGSATTMGYLENLNAGTDAFGWSLATGAEGAQKSEFVAAVFSPALAATPASVTQNPTPALIGAYPNSSVTFTAGVAGTTPITNQWLLNGVALTDNGTNIVGSATTTLNLININTSNAGSYTIMTTNAFGGAVSTSAAVLNVLATHPAFNITYDTFEASGDWNTTGNWNDGEGGQSALTDSLEFPGSTFELLPGSLLRTPAETGLTYTNFPGVSLRIDGSGVWVNNPTAGSQQAEMRFKEGASGETNYFPLLVMAGGQLDSGVSFTTEIAGTINVISNAIIYVDSSAGTGAMRPYQIDAYLEGNGNIEYHEWTNNLTGGWLIITGNTNTYTGTWNIVQGPLIGVGSNCLGTNSITIGANGFLETTYGIDNPNSTLTLNGQMFLTTNDTFGNVLVAGTLLAPGYYPYTTLNAEYPNNFPATFTELHGTTATAAAGSITVIGLPPSILTNPTPSAISVFPTETVEFTAAGLGQPVLSNYWFFNTTNLTDGTNADGSVIIGSATTTLIVSNVTAAEAGDYTFAISNSSGGAVSAAAVLTVTPFYPPQNITLEAFEAGGQDWNTAGVWADTLGFLPASVSAFEAPGSTYEVLPGALLRTPAEAITYTNFPGVSLQVDGIGVWTNNPPAGTAQAEIRFKSGLPLPNMETNYFPLLIMAGGQLDNGNPGTAAEIAGNMDIISNTPIYAVDTGSTGDRPWQIDAYMFGNGNIEYHDSDATLSGGLYITGTSNTYTGTWNVVQGPLVAGGSNCLGTNNITIGATGVLETLYNVSNTTGNLTLNGRMFLCQDDTFNQVSVGGVGLSAGTYSYLQLAASFPAAFPLTFTNIFGSTITNASGSITVLSSLVLPPYIASQPPTNAEEFAGASVTYSVTAGGNAGLYQWYVNGSLVSGATGSSYTFIAATGSNSYSCVVSNAAGVVSNVMAANTASTPPVVVTFSDTNNWTLQGSGVTPSNYDNVLTLTTNGLSEAASAFYNIAQYIEGFNTTFTYTPSGNIAADGVTFCIQNSAAGPAALGGLGGSLGYLGITNSAAFELNIFSGAAGGPGIGFGANGSISTNYSSVEPVTIYSGDPINVNLYYSQGVLQAMLTDSITEATFVTNVDIGDIGVLVGDSVGYIGFTGATGGEASTQQISNFSFVPATAPVVSISNSGSGTITLNWSGGVITNLLLQTSSSVTGPWSNVPVTPSVVGTQYQVTLPASQTTQYFILGLQ